MMTAPSGKTIKESRHTHYLICQENLDNVVAVLDTRDYFRAPQRTRKYIMENLADKPSFVPESMKANTMFRQMKESRQYFNVIVNEYGGVCGIITLHDIMEALVGDLDDQEEAAKPRISSKSPSENGKFRVPLPWKRSRKSSR